MDLTLITFFVAIFCGLINANIITTPMPNENVQGRNLFGLIRPQYPNNYYPGNNNNNYYPGNTYPGTNNVYPGTSNVYPGNFNPGGNTYYPNRPNIYFPNNYPNRPNIYPSRPNIYPNPNYQPDYVYPNNGFYQPPGGGSGNTNVNPRPSYYSG